ncbi:MAG: hypothetical protein ACRCYR_19350 [Phycicoccus sp.]
MHHLPVRQLLGLLRGLLLHPLHVPDLQPRDVLVRTLLGQLRRLRLCRLRLPDMHPRRLTARPA